MLKINCVVTVQKYIKGKTVREKGKGKTLSLYLNFGINEVLEMFSEKMGKQGK